MLQRRQSHSEIIINGTSLPEEYWNADIYDTLAIAKNGINYSYVEEDGTLHTGKTGTPGKISIDNKVIEYAMPKKDEQLIKANVFLEYGKMYIGRLPEVEESVTPINKNYSSE